MDSGALPAFPAELSQADEEYLFLAKVLRLSLVCVPCQTSILTTFHALSHDENTGLQLTPSHVLNLKHYPKLVRREARLVCLEATIAALENPDLFELNLVRGRWVAMFERARRTGISRPTTTTTTTATIGAAQAEEWLAKLWFASLGTYTVLDAASGRQFLCGPFSFTAMHELRLRVSERPHHGALCACPDARWQQQDDDRHARLAVVHDRYTDPQICDVYDTLRRAAAAAGYPLPLPLANVFDLPQFRTVLDPSLRAAAAAELPLMLAGMRDKAVALRRTIDVLRLSLGPPEAPLDDPTGGPPRVPLDDPEAASPVAAVE